jgi:hypothetical protein
VRSQLKFQRSISFSVAPPYQFGAQIARSTISDLSLYENSSCFQAPSYLLWRLDPHSSTRAIDPNSSFRCYVTPTKPRTDTPAITIHSILLNVIFQTLQLSHSSCRFHHMCSCSAGTFVRWYFITIFRHSLFAASRI